MVRLEIIRCDVCKKEHDAEYMLPPDWITTKQNTSHGTEEEKHFCGSTCLGEWAKASLPASQTKTRRFALSCNGMYLYDGVLWGNGYVSTAAYADITLEQFKADHEADDIAWIDGEVAK